MTEQGKKPRRGCLFYTLIAGLLLLLVFIGGAILGLHYAKQVVNQLTDTEPMSLPKVQMSDEQVDELRDRVERFREAVQKGNTVEPLALTADELNALIATHPDVAPFRNRLFILSITNNRVQALVTIPAEEAGLEPLRGKYVNANGNFSIAMKDDGLHVNAESLLAKGKPLPEHVMKQLRTRNLAQKFNTDPRSKAGLGKIQSIEIRDGKLIIVPRKDQAWNLPERGVHAASAQFAGE